MVRQSKSSGLKELKEYKDFRKELEVIGIDVHKGSIRKDDDELMNGLSFEANVDIVRFLNTIDPNEEKYPRTKETYKKGLFSVEIIRTSDDWFNEHTMDIRIENVLDTRQVKEDDVEKLCEDIIEGGEEIDKIAEVSNLILVKAKEKARELYLKVK